MPVVPLLVCSLQNHASMKEIVKVGAEYLALSMELFAAVIIATGAIRAIINYVRTKGSPPRESIRWSFGHTLVFALEFLLAADILLTAIAPTWNEIGQLAAIAVLRTALNYFLEKELHRLEKKPNNDVPGAP